MSKRIRSGRNLSRSLGRGALITAGLSLGLAGVAQAQLKPGSQSGLGLTGADIPPILQQIRADPYRMPAAPVCASIDQEMAQLDTVMGPDVDKLKTDRSVADRAAGYIRGMIPYRGVVRFLTRADSKDRELQAAASAGYARRGFLHGLKAQNHCDGASADTRVAAVDKTSPPARPATAAPAEVRLAAADAPSVDLHGADASARAPDPQARIAAADARVAEADAKVAETDARVRAVPVADRAPASGERLSDEMLNGPAPDAPPPAAPAAVRPASAHVVYQLIDTTSGRPIVPDPPGSGPGGR
ncbi:hypothetical protein [Phenylobacterium sp.]|jgi:hypothetical protein|uniref:hypothetical protein n=1 Tax=Phenylobacterium sp. TaxID=1871053 RepID=UPI002F3EECDF